IPILNIPMIHFIVQEAVASGIKNILFVTSEGKSELENYFKPNLALEKFLKEKGKKNELNQLHEINEMAKIESVIQDQQLGLGHAVLTAEKWVGQDSFAVLLGDDIVWGDQPATLQLMQVSQKLKGASVIGVMNVEQSETNKYGIVD